MAETEYQHKWPSHYVLSVYNEHIIGANAYLKQDIERLCPHAKAEPKFYEDESRAALSALALQRNCDQIAYYETQHHRSLFLQFATSVGPTVKFEVFEIISKNSVTFSGNFFKNTRPLLSFDKFFDESVPMRIIKELLKRQFATPNLHFKSAPFVDHLVYFTCVDHRYLIIEMRVFSFSDSESVQETGPFCTLFPMSMYYGVFGGEIIWKNTKYVTHAARKAFDNQKIVKKVQRKRVYREMYAKADRVGVRDELDEFWTQRGWDETW